MSAAKNTDEARLYTLQGSLTTQTACSVDFASNSIHFAEYTLMRKALSKSHSKEHWLKI